MRLHLVPAPLLHLIATILLAPSPTIAGPHPARSALGGFTYDELFARWECSGTKCGYYDQVCCTAGSGCFTNSLTQATCTPHATAEGHWTYSTKTTVMTDRETITTVVSHFVAETATAKCNYALRDTKCGTTCCPKGYYCKDPSNNDCAPAYVGETTTTAVESESAAPTGSATPADRGTSHSQIDVTQTQSPTTTVALLPPARTGADITMTEIHHNSSLSGGAIAGIVIGVLVALFLLGLLCFYCCLKGIWDGLLAIFGMDRRRKVTEVDEYTRRSHYSSGGQKRTWYGAPVKTKKSVKDSHVGRDLVGLGAGLAGLWAILGLKRRREDNRRRAQQEKYQSEYSYSSDYYTSESSASSDDRRTERYSRHSTRRSDTRRN